MGHPSNDSTAAGAAPKGFQAVVDQACARWIAFVVRRRVGVLSVAGLATAGLAIYAALNLGVNSDPRALIEASLPFQQRQRALEQTFHTLGNGILVVVDADSPFAAGRAADALATKLGARADLFTQVYVPGGGPFFARNALLYLDPGQLEDLVDRLGTVQPFLAELARDQSLVGITALLQQALAAQREGTRVGLDLATALDRVSVAVEATGDGTPSIDPWGTALLGGAMPPEAKRRVIALRPVLDYGTLLNSGPAVDAIRADAVALGLVPERGVTVRITGEPVLNYEELIAIGRNTRLVGLASFVLFSLIVSWALRAPRIIVGLLGGLVVSLVWTNAFATAAVGHLNQISATVNVLIVGLGGEFGIHFCMRYAELLGQGRGRASALRDTGFTIGSSLVSSAVTTSIGFFIFMLTDFTGVAQLGLIAGTGMFISLASTLTVTPALLALGSEPTPRPAKAPPAWLAGLEHWPLRHARAIRWTALTVALASLALLPFVRFDHNLLNLRDPWTESVSTFEDLLARAGTTPWTIDVTAPSLDAAQALSAQLRGLDVVRETRTLLDWVPADQAEKQEILETASYFVPPRFDTGPPRTPAEQRAALEGLAAEARKTAGSDRGPLAASATRLATAIDAFLRGPGAEGASPAVYAALQQNVVGSLPEQVTELGPLLAPQEVTVADLPDGLRQQFLAPDGKARVEVVPRDDVTESATLEHFVDRVRTVASEASGGAVWNVEWGRVTWKAMLAALVGGMLAMLVFLVVLWRSVWDTLLAFFPLALASVTTCAVLVLTGAPFNFANVIVLPMLVGMGVDNGVQLVHRHRTNPDEVDVLGTSTARAVFFSAVTTVASFGSMGFASHRGMASLGQLLAIGVAVTLVCYVVVLPAVLEWDDRRRRARESRVA